MASHVLHRFLVPRHPPCALKNLATDARVHCAVLKQRPATHHPEPVKSSSALGPATEEKIRSFPQTPNSVPDTFAASFIRSTPKQYWEEKPSEVCRVVNVPPMSNQHQTFADVLASDRTKSGKKCSLERR